MRLKKAFTLAETLIVFIIIGIVASVGVSTVKPWEKAYKYAYSRIYNALSITMFNYMTTQAITDAGAFPANSGEFCCTLLEYMNTAGDKVYSNSAIRQDNCPKNANGKFNPGTLHVCSKADLVKDPTPDKFETNNPGIKMLKLSNSSYMWFASANNKLPFSATYTDSIGTTTTFKYYLVFVDLNGSRRPNTPQWTNNISPDIVAFAVTDKYTVLPLGYPQFDTKYLSAHVVYPAVNDTEDGNSDDTETLSDAMTFYEARVRAYGLDISGKEIISSNDIFSVDYEDLIGLSDKTNEKHFFRIKNIANRYETAPQFDETLCQQEILEDNGTRTKLMQPICEVRIFDYH